MFFYEGQSCPVCGKHFGENDDIVACPQCGCPHHRDCWKQEGHCHFEADHGTPQQWAQGTVHTAPRKTTTACPHCGCENPEFAEFCAGCGRELKPAEPQTPPVGQYTPPTGNYTPPFRQQPFQVPLQDPYGGVSREEQIEGVSVDQITELVGPNSAYYLPRFLKMSRGGSKVSWNWAAFLIPYNWLLYRKNIAWGALVFLFTQALSFISQMAMTPIEKALDMTSQTAMMESMLKLAENPRMYLLMLIVSAVMFIDLLVRVLVALFGNYLYMRQIVKKAQQLQENPAPQYNRNFRTVGGTSFALAIAPELLLMFAMYVLMFFNI